MENKKGFTLIELLAVITVLAIIILIAAPKVVEVINNAEKAATERSGEGYIRKVEATVATERMKGNKLEGTYTINSDGNLEDNGLTEPLEIKVNGDKPTDGTITISNGKVISDGTVLTIGDYTVTCSDGKCSVAENDSDSEPGQAKEIYTNGDEVYFNVDDGTTCTSSEAVSTTGTKNGCMRFYAFNDDGGDTVNLILDHNTTTFVAWNSDDILEGNASGPKEVIEQLKIDTDSWQGTITPENYTMDQSTQYTGASGTNKYAWLFSYTYGCRTYGCNAAGSSSKGYWTASSHASNDGYAWLVSYTGGLLDLSIFSDINVGVRPVIEVSKSKLS